MAQLSLTTRMALDALIQTDGTQRREVSVGRPAENYSAVLSAAEATKQGRRTLGYDVSPHAPSTTRTWSGGISALAWLTPRRLVGWEPAGLFMLDPVARRRLDSPRASGDVVSTQRAGNQLVLLTAPSQELGAAQLALVGADGAVRTVLLDRIRAGMRPEGDGMGESYRPAVVFDRIGRVFVVGCCQYLTRAM